MITTLEEAITHAREVANEKRFMEDHWTKQDKDDKWHDKRQSWITECKECAEEHEQLAEWLEELAERREADRWIPVSERLPEKYDSYLVMWRSLTEGFPDRLFYEICEYEPDEDEWERIEQAGKAGAEIVAWRPLPKLYESEDSE